MRALRLHWVRSILHGAASLLVFKIRLLGRSDVALRSRNVSDGSYVKKSLRNLHARLDSLSSLAISVQG